MSRFNLKRVGYAVLFVAFLFELVAIAPHGGNPWIDLLKLAAFQAPGNNAAVLGVFWIVGLEIMLYWPLILGDRRPNPIPKRLVCGTMLLFGSLALLPYLAARSTAPLPEGAPPEGMLRTKTYAVFVGLGLFASVIFAVLMGDWMGYAKLFRTNFFIHGMTVDCLLLALLFPALTRDELNGLGYYEDNLLFRLVVAIPIFGPALYLSMKPQPR